MYVGRYIICQLSQRCQQPPISVTLLNYSTLRFASVNVVVDGSQSLQKPRINGSLIQSVIHTHETTFMIGYRQPPSRCSRCRKVFPGCALDDIYQPFPFVSSIFGVSKKVQQLPYIPVEQCSKSWLVDWLMIIGGGTTQYVGDYKNPIGKSL